MKDKPSWFIGIGLIVVAVVAGIVVRVSTAAGDDRPAAFEPPAGTLSAVDARAEINYIPVLDRHATAPQYERAEFGVAWTDVDGNRCDTRDDILARDAQRAGGTYETTNGCTVVGIEMTEPYAGVHVTSKSELDIDHVVPLKVAWVSGAYAWNARVRLNLANDPRNLLAVDDDTNQHAKGDKTPDRWLPAPAARCEYARMYVTVLKAYELPAYAATRTTLADTLRDCA